MVGKVLPRFLAAAGALVAAVAMTLGAAPLAAQAAPKPAVPSGVTITGKAIDGKLTVQAADQPGLVNQLLSEVNWLATATPQISAPKADRLGAKYVLTVLVKDKPTYAYDLYPEASGGPRAHRPAKQPSGKKVADGWFYGRLSMSESLRVSGVPLTPRTESVNGGIGGGIGSGVVQDELDPVAGVNDFLNELRQLFLLNGAVLMIIMIGLAGIAFLVRRRV